jgi:serine/threonine-protein phosphatase 2A activator
MAYAGTPSHVLQVLDRHAGHAFKLPKKCIHDGDDVSFFLASKAYADIMTFIFQLNASMIPRKNKDEEKQSDTIRAWTLQDPHIEYTNVVKNLAQLIGDLDSLIEQAPPDPGPRRFGNISFRRWHELVEKQVSDLTNRCLPLDILELHSESDVTAKAELEAYLLGSFGSAQRLDYGTGHELSFLAFLGCLWKLGAFPKSEDGSQERGIVLGVVEPYVPMRSRKPPD